MSNRAGSSFPAIFKRCVAMLDFIQARRDTGKHVSLADLVKRFDLSRSQVLNVLAHMRELKAEVVYDAAGYRVVNRGPF